MDYLGKIFLTTIGIVIVFGILFVLGFICLAIVIAYGDKREKELDGEMVKYRPCEDCGDVICVCDAKQD